MRRMIADGYQDARTLQRRIDRVQNWLDNPQLLEADADAKFRTWEWNYGHSPVAAFRVRRKFLCGTVEASFSLKNGRIDGLRFGGDFLGALPPDGIERALQGCRYTREDLRTALQNAPVGASFDALSAEELATLLVDA